MLQNNQNRLKQDTFQTVNCCIVKSQNSTLPAKKQIVVLQQMILLIFLLT